MKKYTYQWRALLLMVLAWGVAGLVHNCIAFLFPYFSTMFDLTTSHNGYLTGTLAFFWTLSIIIFGRIADKIGQVRIMVPGLMVGGVALFFTAASHSVIMLYVLTAITGFGCGSIVSSSLSFLAEQSNPKYRGLFFGAAQSSFTLIGSALGSVILTRLGASIVGWRGCYIILAMLVTIAALFLFSFGRNIPRTVKSEEKYEKQSFKLLIEYKNVILSTNLASLTMMWYFTVASFTILYLIEVKGLSVIVAGGIFAGFGCGGFIGEFFAPLISDKLGRKTTVLLATLIGGICFVCFIQMALSAVWMTIFLAGASFFMSGSMAILNSVVPSESVPCHLVATATAFTPACGELMGGVFAPVIAGGLTLIVGMSQIMNILTLLPSVVFIGALFLQETSPCVLERRMKREQGML